MMDLVNSDKNEKKEKVNNFFIQIFDRLSKDDQKFVRYACIETLGNYVYRLDQSERNEDYLFLYINFVKAYYTNIDISNTLNSIYCSVIFYSAYNFPAMLYCYGIKYWDRLYDIYIYFISENNDKIKKSIIQSFHEVSNILGNDMSIKYLLPSFRDLLKYQNNPTFDDSIQEMIPKYLKTLNENERLNYIHLLQVANNNVYSY
jgi:hypothetical protein